MTRAIALAVLALAPLCAGSRNAAQVQPTPGVEHQVVLTQYVPLFSNAEILRRLLSPLALEGVRDTLARTNEALSPYPLDLAKEKFLLYVPPTPPPSPRGFALLVFVPPRDEPVLPLGWATQLDHYGVIFVSPAGAGNEAAVLSRRVPLALSAEGNVVREYAVDPERIYIGGFSGGSRVALRIALGYPDVFRGALLEAGADPVGNSKYPLPPRDLFLRFQSSSHLVYVRGILDTFDPGADANSAQSMHDWCVADVETHEVPGMSHQAMDSATFGRALERLLNQPRSDAAHLDACRSHIEAVLRKKLDQAQALIARGRREPARKLLLNIDAQYAGLAAPRTVALARSCDCGLAVARQRASTE